MRIRDVPHPDYVALFGPDPYAVVVDNGCEVSNRVMATVTQTIGGGLAIASDGDMTVLRSISGDYRVEVRRSVDDEPVYILMGCNVYLGDRVCVL